MGILEGPVDVAAQPLQVGQVRSAGTAARLAIAIQPSMVALVSGEPPRFAERADVMLQCLGGKAGAVPPHQVDGSSRQVAGHVDQQEFRVVAGVGFRQEGVVLAGELQQTARPVHAQRIVGAGQPFVVELDPHQLPVDIHAGFVLGQQRAAQIAHTRINRFMPNPVLCDPPSGGGAVCRNGGLGIVIALVRAQRSPVDPDLVQPALNQSGVLFGLADRADGGIVGLLHQLDQGLADLVFLDIE